MRSSIARNKRNIADGAVGEANALRRDCVAARLAPLGFSSHFAQRIQAEVIQEIFGPGIIDASDVALARGRVALTVCNPG